MRFGVLLLSVRFGISGAVYPIKQQETFISCGHQFSAGLANQFSFALTSQMTKGWVDVANDLPGAIHYSYAQAGRFEDGIDARSHPSASHLAIQPKGIE
jgi:hypothetical protein